MGRFRQLFDPPTSAYTYLLADVETRDAVVIDCVPGQTATVLACLDELDLTLRYLVATHVHAGERDATAALRARTGACAAGSEAAGARWLQARLRHGDTIVFGGQVLRTLATPGHTAGCLSYLWQDRVFTGDALLIGGCGCTRLPGGDAGSLYDSVTRRLFTLPGETLVYPAHDEHGRTVSTIAEEREHNPCFAGRSRDEFVTRMSAAAGPADAGASPMPRRPHLSQASRNPE